MSIDAHGWRIAGTRSSTGYDNRQVMSKPTRKMGLYISNRHQAHFTLHHHAPRACAIPVSSHPRGNQLVATVVAFAGSGPCSRGISSPHFPPLSSSPLILHYNILYIAPSWLKTTFSQAPSLPHEAYTLRPHLNRPIART